MRQQSNSNITSPARVRMNIRDMWTAPESNVQKSIASLKKLIGHEVVIEPEWALLWAELQKHYSEPGLFVPAVASTVEAWCTSLCELADDDTNEEWTETLLEKLNGPHMLKVLFDVSDGRSSTKWSEQQQGFGICFPKSKPLSLSTMVAGFHDDLRNAFKEQDVIPLAQRSSIARAEEDGFTEIDPSDLDTASILTPVTTERYVAPRAAISAKLSSVNMIERPEELMKKPPYHLIVAHTHYGKEITIQCSHQPSLELISEYFKRWSKRNHNQTTKPAAAEITMKESCFGLGLMYDRLELVVNSYDYKHGLSPPLILAFVESVLGYRITYNDASSWTFRRDVAFA